MKTSKIFVGILIVLNIFLIVSIFSILIRMNKLDDSIKEIANLIDKESVLEESDVNKSIDEIDSSTLTDQELLDRFEEIILRLKDYENIEERLSSLEVEGNTELRQRIVVTEIMINRIQDLILRQDNINVKYGTIKGIQENENIILEIREYDPNNEEYRSELVSLEVTNDCKPYFYSEIGLVQASIQDLIEKVTIEVNENFEDDYTFIIIDGKVVQVYQGYSQ